MVHTFKGVWVGGGEVVVDGGQISCFRKVVFSNLPQFETVKIFNFNLEDI